MHVKTLHDDYEKLGEIHHTLLGDLQALTAKMKCNEFTMRDLADIGFLCREMENLCDDFRKDFKARKEVAIKLLAHKLLTDPDNLNDEDATDRVSGELATATIDVKKFAQLPLHGTEEFCRLMDHLGVPVEAYDSGLIKFDWQKLKKEVTRRLEFGEKLPPGLGQLYTEFTARFTRKKQCPF